MKNFKPWAPNILSWINPFQRGNTKITKTFRSANKALKHFVLSYANKCFPSLFFVFLTFENSTLPMSYLCRCLKIYCQRAIFWDFHLPGSHISCYICTFWLSVILYWHQTTSWILKAAYRDLKCTQKNLSQTLKTVYCHPVNCRSLQQHSPYSLYTESTATVIHPSGMHLDMKFYDNIYLLM